MNFAVISMKKILRNVVDAVVFNKVAVKILSAVKDIYTFVSGKVSVFVKNNRIAVKIGAFCIVTAFFVAVSLFASGVTYGFKVSYDGEEIALVKDSSVFDDAEDLAASNVNGKVDNILLAKPKFVKTLTVASRLTDAAKLADMLIEKNKDVTYASGVTVNGETVAVVENFDVEDYLKTCLDRYKIDGAVNYSEFLDDVSVVKGYYMSDEVNSLNDAVAILDALQVRTSSTVVSDVAIPFSTVTEKTSSQVIGYSAVKVAGQNGIERKTERVVTLNGVESERTLVSDETVSSPVDKVVVIGTAHSLASASQRKAASGAGFVFPLPKGSWTVSSYYGDGRSHKAVDLAAKKGTSIFAAKGGTVTFAGSNGNYGQLIVIDHGNGLVTRYAHASAIFVSKGETVTAGQVIGQVGSTGYSTGNHLHFEVLSCGKNVDPAPYIGLG